MLSTSGFRKRRVWLACIVGGLAVFALATVASAVTGAGSTAPTAASPESDSTGSQAVGPTVDAQYLPAGFAAQAVPKGQTGFVVPERTDARPAAPEPHAGAGVIPPATAKLYRSTDSRFPGTLLLIADKEHLFATDLSRLAAGERVVNLGARDARVTTLGSTPPGFNGSSYRAQWSERGFEFRVVGVGVTEDDFLRFIGDLRVS